MKANELMIGDWARLRYKHWVTNEEVVKDFKVSQVRKAWDGDELDAWCSESGNMGKVSRLEPIPLTPEILEKNGFDVSDPEVAQYHFKEDGQRMHFSLRRMYDSKTGEADGYSFFAFNVLSLVVYVHDLQHALRLCGIEKEIEL